MRMRDRASARREPEGIHRHPGGRRIDQRDAGARDGGRQAGRGLQRSHRNRRQLGVAIGNLEIVGLSNRSEGAQ